MRIDDEVPDFELPDQDGVARRLSSLLAQGPVVFFFYPAAMTSGCTKEACHFRDVAAEYAAAGVQRVGISCDSVAAQKEFADLHSLDYPLLSDESGAVAEIFDVKRGKIGQSLGSPVRRSTFAIGKDQKLVAVIQSQVNMDTHADEALVALTS